LLSSFYFPSLFPFLYVTTRMVFVGLGSLWGFTCLPPSPLDFDSFLSMARFLSPTEFIRGVHFYMLTHSSCIALFPSFPDANDPFFHLSFDRLCIKLLFAPLSFFAGKGRPPGRKRFSQTGRFRTFFLTPYFFIALLSLPVNLLPRSSFPPSSPPNGELPALVRAFFP